MSSKSRKTVYADSVLNRSETSNSLSWPEWSDNELNGEPWDYPKGGEFSDSQQVVLPRSLQPVEWKRFREFKYTTSPIVYEPISSYPDLITNNKHLMHSEFIRCFVSTLINLQYCGRNGLEIENTTINFSWNLADQCWQGWFNVYSLNKAGKGAPHRPVYNPNGRYVVRIFYMGCWRRILTDDSIPVDKSGKPLLPRTSNVNELWPMILAKAMLKIAALSWTPKREMVDCSLITCLTGWIGLSLNVTHLSSRDQWELIAKYAKHFEWPRNEISPANQAKSDVPEKSMKSRKSRTKVTKLEVPEDSQPTLLFLSLEDTRNADNEKIPGVTPCWSHQIYVELSRDVPLDPAQVRRPLAKWKNYRWLDWAMSRGLADASEYFVPVRHLLVVSPLRQCTGKILYNQDGTEELEEEEEKDWPETKLLSGGDSKTDKIQSATSKVSKGKSGDSEIPDISMWADFNKLSYYLREVDLFYRQKFFKYSIRVSDNSARTFATNEAKKSRPDSSAKDVKKSAAKTSGQPLTSENIYEYDDKISQSRNEPLYLFVDSVDDKFFLVNFSTTTPVNLDDSGTKKSSHLIIERHNWFDRSMKNRSIGRIKTRGTASMVFQLEPGRHLLKIFINFETSYRAIVLSDTPFKIGNRLKMHELMIVEAARIAETARRISNSVKAALESFGTPSYASSLKTYYQSYMPDSSLGLGNSHRRVLKSIHDWFADEFFKLLEKRFSTIDLVVVQRAMRIFFYDPSIGTKQARSSSNNYSWEENDEEEEEEEKEEESDPNRHATIIQSFFRLARIKRYREIHEASHEEHYRVKDALGRVVEIFNYERHEHGANYLLREVVKRDKILETLYSWVEDLKHVIEIQEVVGRVTSISNERWIPIVRTRVNTEKSETVFAAIDLFVNSSNYTVRVFENDTTRELTGVVNNVTANLYRYRDNGYTIFAYGWSDTQKYLEWSLHLATIKGEAKFRWINEIQRSPGKIEPRPLFVREIIDTYVPNSRDCMFRIIAKVRATTLVSLRLRTSYDRVLAKLRIIKENDSAVIAEIEGCEILTLPIVFLEYDGASEPEIDSREKLSDTRKSASNRRGSSLSRRSGNISGRDSSTERQIVDSSTRYLIEANVRKDSWPLTQAEWTAVAEVRNRESANLGKNRRSTTGARKSERSRHFSKKSLVVGESVRPCWILQIVTDLEDELEIAWDTSREDKIRELMRVSRTPEEPGRSERGRKLRESFIQENSLTMPISAIDSRDESIESGQEDEEKIYTSRSLEDEILTLNKRTLVPPENLTKYLPKLDFTIYMVREDEEEDRWVKTDYDEEALRNQRAINVLDFEQLRSLNLEESSMLMEKRREKYRQITRRYSDNRDNRARDMNEAYEMRQAYVESTRDTARSVKSKDSAKPKKGR